MVDPFRLAQFAVPFEGGDCQVEAGSRRSLAKWLGLGTSSSSSSLSLLTSASAAVAAAAVAPTPVVRVGAVVLVLVDHGDRPVEVDL